MSFKITGVNKLVLMNKYKGLGWSYDRINEHINYLNNYFDIKYNQLKKKNKSEEEINNKFLEEFAKLIS